VVLTSAAVILAAALTVGLAASVLMESPVMEYRISPAAAGSTGGDFRNRAAVSDFLAIRMIIADRSRGLSPELTDLLAEVILDESIRYGLDPALVLAIIETESSFRNRARSERNALGFMQVLPTTGEDVARRIDVEWKGEASLYLPVVNIKVGTYYFNQLVERFDSVELALAAYNRGPNAVNRIIGRGRTPSRTYSKKVLSNYREIKPFFSLRTS
jgi:soluble lytic murein transglycosylase